MTTSGSYAFDLVGDELLDEAWERCGLDPRQITERHVVSGLRSMQLLLTTWTNAGLNLWQVDRQTAALAADVATVTTPAGTTDILEAYVTVSGLDRLLSPIARDEWMGLSEKTLSGVPTTYWVERINAVPVIHLYPVQTTAMSLTYSRIRLPQDITALTQSVDAPALWFDALAAELALRLAGKFAQARLADLQANATKTFDLAAAENRERVSVTLIPAIA